MHKQFFKYTMLIAIACSIFAPSHVAKATGVKTVIKDGEVHFVTDPSAPRFPTITCSKMSAYLRVFKVKGEPPYIMATIVIDYGKEKKPFRLFDVAKNALTEGHDISGLKLGCLTRNGGVGIYVPHESDDDLALSIQLDTRGHVFLGYDDIGLKLKTPNPEAMQ